jgi:hypothetical protein
MNQELLDIIKPQIQAKSQHIYSHFAELAEEERQAVGEPCGDRQTDEWIDGELECTNFFGDYIEIDDADIHEQIDNDPSLQTEFNELTYNIIMGKVR